MLTRRVREGLEDLLEWGVATAVRRWIDRSANSETGRFIPASMLRSPEVTARSSPENRRVLAEGPLISSSVLVRLVAGLVRSA